MQTASDIMQVLEVWAAEKRPIDPQAYLDAASKMVLLSGDESDKLYQMEQNVARMRVELLEQGMNATNAKMRVEASDEFREARSQKALIERINDTVLLAKARARLAMEEYRAQ